MFFTYLILLFTLIFLLISIQVTTHTRVRHWTVGCHRPLRWGAGISPHPYKDRHKVCTRTYTLICDESTIFIWLLSYACLILILFFRDCLTQTHTHINIHLHTHKLTYPLSHKLRPSTDADPVHDPHAYDEHHEHGNDQSGTPSLRLYFA